MEGEILEIQERLETITEEGTIYPTQKDGNVKWYVWKNGRREYLSKKNDKEIRNLVNKKYLELALLHDCGKENANVIRRVIHKIGLRTLLRLHPENGAKKLGIIDPELAILIKNHHISSYSTEMTEFQKIDDLC